MINLDYDGLCPITKMGLYELEGSTYKQFATQEIKMDNSYNLVVNTGKP